MKSKSKKQAPKAQKEDNEKPVITTKPLYKYQHPLCPKQEVTDSSSKSLLERRESELFKPSTENISDELKDQLAPFLNFHRTVEKFNSFVKSGPTGKGSVQTIFRNDNDMEKESFASGAKSNFEAESSSQLPDSSKVSQLIIDKNIEETISPLVPTDLDSMENIIEELMKKTKKEEHETVDFDQKLRHDIDTVEKILDEIVHLSQEFDYYYDSENTAKDPEKPSSQFQSTLPNGEKSNRKVDEVGTDETWTVESEIIENIKCLKNNIIHRITGKGIADEELTHLFTEHGVNTTCDSNILDEVIKPIMPEKHQTNNKSLRSKIPINPTSNRRVLYPKPVTYPNFKDASTFVDRYTSEVESQTSETLWIPLCSKEAATCDIEVNCDLGTVHLNIDARDENEGKLEETRETQTCAVESRPLIFFNTPSINDDGLSFIKIGRSEELKEPKVSTGTLPMSVDTCVSTENNWDKLIEEISAAHYLSKIPKRKSLSIDLDDKYRVEPKFSRPANQKRKTKKASATKSDSGYSDNLNAKLISSKSTLDYNAAKKQLRSKLSGNPALAIDLRRVGSAISKLKEKTSNLPKTRTTASATDRPLSVKDTKSTTQFIEQQRKEISEKSRRISFSNLNDIDQYLQDEGVKRPLPSPDYELRGKKSIRAQTTGSFATTSEEKLIKELEALADGTPKSVNEELKSPIVVEKHIDLAELLKEESIKLNPTIRQQTILRIKIPTKAPICLKFKSKIDETKTDKGRPVIEHEILPINPRSLFQSSNSSDPTSCKQPVFMKGKELAGGEKPDKYSDLLQLRKKVLAEIEEINDSPGNLDSKTRGKNFEPPDTALKETNSSILSIPPDFQYDSEVFSELATNDTSSQLLDIKNLLSSSDFHLSKEDFLENKCSSTLSNNLSSINKLCQSNDLSLTSLSVIDDKLKPLSNALHQICQQIRSLNSTKSKKRSAKKSSKKHATERASKKQKSELKDELKKGLDSPEHQSKNVDADAKVSTSKDADSMSQKQIDSNESSEQSLEFKPLEGSFCDGKDNKPSDKMKDLFSKLHEFDDLLSKNIKFLQKSDEKNMENIQGGHLGKDDFEKESIKSQSRKSKEKQSLPKFAKYFSSLDPNKQIDQFIQGYRQNLYKQNASNSDTKPMSPNYYIKLLSGHCKRPPGSPKDSSLPQFRPRSPFGSSWNRQVHSEMDDVSVFSEYNSDDEIRLILEDETLNNNTNQSTLDQIPTVHYMEPLPKGHEVYASFGSQTRSPKSVHFPNCRHNTQPVWFTPSGQKCLNVGLPLNFNFHTVRSGGGAVYK